MRFSLAGSSLPGPRARRARFPTCGVIRVAGIHFSRSSEGRFESPHYPSRKNDPLITTKSEIFKIFFQKHPPRIVSHFKQVKGLLIFFSKHPPFFRFPVQTSEGINFLKEIFEKSVNLGVHFGTLCPNE